MFDHIRAAITHPDQLLAGQQAVTLHTPIPDDELLSAELARLDRKIDAADTERRRLIDLYQGGFIELPEMQRRATEVSARRKELQHKRTSLAHERTALARDNQLRLRVHDFAARIHAVIDTLDDTQKQQLLRLLIEDVRVTGWHVQIRLRIALDPPPPSRHSRPAQQPQAQQANRHHTRARCQPKTVCVPLVATQWRQLPHQTHRDRITALRGSRSSGRLNPVNTCSHFNRSRLLRIRPELTVVAGSNPVSPTPSSRASPPENRSGGE